MARPALFTSKKFFRLSRILGAHYRAVGVLEMLWRPAYETGNPEIGSAEDVEFMVGWDGEPGALVTALIESEFLDVYDGVLWVHDLADHCPEYVLERFRKEAARRGKTVNREQIRETIRSLYPDRQPDDPGTVPGQYKEVVGTPAPAPAPAPSTSTHSATPNGATTSATGKKTTFPKQFEEFWRSYPKKKKKGDALKAWKTTAEGRPPLKELLAKLEMLKSSYDWTKEGGRYIPYPATWLRASGWEDEIEVEVGKHDRWSNSRSEKEYGV